MSEQRKPQKPEVKNEPDLTEVQASASSAKSSMSSKGIYLLPNLFTLMAMFSGFYAIVAAMNHHFETAAIAILIAMVFDALDGRVARMIGAQSAFGAELDSLSDLVSFGVAPALVLYNWSLSHMGKIGWLAAFLYMACTALRLARFNITDVDEKRYFFGLPTPVAAGFVASCIWAACNYGVVGEHLSIVTLVVAIVLAGLKVSRVRYRSFKDLNLEGKVPFVVIVVLVLIFLLISWDPADILMIISGVFILSGPVMWLFSRRKRNRNRS